MWSINFLVALFWWHIGKRYFVGLGIDLCLHIIFLALLWLLSIRTLVLWFIHFGYLLFLQSFGLFGMPIIRLYLKETFDIKLYYYYFFYGLLLGKFILFIQITLIILNLFSSTFLSPYYLSSVLDPPYLRSKYTNGYCSIVQGLESIGKLIQEKISKIVI